MKKIVPFKCVQCHQEFDFPAGGLCFQCRKIFCKTHLYKVEEDKEISYFCETCKGIRIGEKLEDYLLSITRKPKKLRPPKE
jgi:hypothetical protein